MTSSPSSNPEIVRRRGDVALAAVAVLSSIGVYFGHDWFHREFLVGLGISAALGDALGGLAIIAVAETCRRMASLVIFRDPEFGQRRIMQQLDQSNRELRRELGHLEHVATTDKLTGCWNRRHLEIIIPGELARLKSYENSISLLVIDVDHFKSINDKLGHRVGDEVLVELAARLQSTLRASDSLVRWGGEEFLILSPNTSLTSAVALAERARALIAGKDFSQAGPVTASIGVAECLQGEGWQEWFDRADEALYRAKSGGRNQVQAAKDPALAPPRLVQLKWHPSYACGNALIDQEHQELFAAANHLLNSVILKKPTGEVGDLMASLIEQIHQHFQSEEAVLAQVGYPRLGEHREAHRQLMARARSLLEGFQAQTLEMGEIFQFLAQDVIAKHLLAGDRDYFGYVRLDGA